MIREFYLENEKGQRLSMMDIENSCFLHSPKGLGYSYNTEYSQIGDNFIQNVRRLAQGKIDGELIIKDYDNYRNVINFIESAEELKFLYRVPYQTGYKEYYKDIDVSSVDKEEIGEGNVLTVPIVFDCKSLWYEPRNITFSIENIENEVRWDFEWDSTFTSYDDRNITIDNKGHAEASIKIELDGQVSNLKISILEDGKEIKTLQLSSLLVESGGKFVYNTKNTEQEIYKIENETKTNLFDLLNPNFIDFFTLRKGESTIRLEANEEILSGKLTVYIQYKAV